MDQISLKEGHAIIELGGKQHLVQVGAKIQVNRMKNEEGSTVELKDILNDIPVSLKVIAHKLGVKISGLKFKAKTRYTKRYGHRQMLTLLEVISIGGVKAEAKTQPKKVEAKVVLKTETKAKIKKEKPVVAKKAVAKKPAVKTAKVKESK